MSTDSLESVEKIGHHIGGRVVLGAKFSPLLNIYSGQVLAQCTVGTPEDVHKAISVAVETQKSTKLAPTELQKILRRAAEITTDRRDEIATVMVEESGMTMKDARGEIDRGIQTLLLSGEEAKRIAGHVVPIQGTPGMESRLAFTIRVPVGVVGAITSFNAPFNGFCHKVGPAIGSGNAVVIKPAPATPRTAILAARILEEAGLPAGFVNVILGDRDVGSALLKDERIGFYSFTGSAAVGRIVKEQTGLRRVALELGNASPVIVCQDANLAQAAPLIVRGGFRKAGQVCVSVQRVYVHRAVMSDLSLLLKGEIAKLKVGDPLDPTTDVGPVITSTKCEELEKWLAAAVEAGAAIAAGGRRLTANMLEPTLVENATQQMSVVSHEVFGPVISLVPFDTIDQAISWANDTEYGLQAGIFTQNINDAFLAARQLQFGGVNINETSNTRGDIMPYGGVKNSGIGREGPYYAMRDMTDERLVMLNV